MSKKTFGFAILKIYSETNHILRRNIQFTASVCLSHFFRLKKLLSSIQLSQVLGLNNALPTSVARLTPLTEKSIL